MPQALMVLIVVLVTAAIATGVTFLIRGKDPGLAPVEPDGYAVPLPGGRPLAERDVSGVRFDVAMRGYRMAQVDRALDRAAYDIGYKDELIGVLEAEIAALRAGRMEDADALRQIRMQARGVASPGADTEGGTEPAAGAVGGTKPAPEAVGGTKPAPEPTEGPEAPSLRDTHPENGDRSSSPAESDATAAQPAPVPSATPAAGTARG